MSFNIDKIIKECPRAWEGCKKYFIHPHNYKDNLKTVWDDKDKYIYVFEDMQGYNTAEIHFRELYDFFASVGIVVIPNTHLLRSKEVFYEEDYYRIYMTNKVDVEQEYRAFEKAFEIYEKQLGEV